MKTLFVAVRAVLYASGFIFFFGWMALGARRYDDRIGAALPGWLKVPGLLLMIPSGILALACIGNFIGRGRGTPAPFDPPRVFVAAGPYRYVRNPMYVGGLFFLAGLALLEGSVSILIFAAVLFIAAHLLVVLYEEPVLRSRFGESYASYLRSVPRWLPRRPVPSS
jgi:protein-S-isoprenylcysteine O-methyltransferase Ste14